MKIAKASIAEIIHDFDMERQHKRRAIAAGKVLRDAGVEVAFHHQGQDVSGVFQSADADGRVWMFDLHHGRQHQIRVDDIIDQEPTPVKPRMIAVVTRLDIRHAPLCEQLIKLLDCGDVPHDLIDVDDVDGQIRAAELLEGEPVLPVVIAVDGRRTYGINALYMVEALASPA